MKRYNAVNSKWLLLGLVIPILLFGISFNITYAYFTATAKEQVSTTETAIVRLGFDEYTGGDKTQKEIMRNSSTVTASTLLPGDKLTAKAKIINNGNVEVYAIFNFKLSITLEGGDTTDIINDFYTFTTNGTITKLNTANYSSNVPCTLAKDASVELVVPAEFSGETYTNTYQNAHVVFTFTGYAIQTSHITEVEAIGQMLQLAN